MTENIKDSILESKDNNFKRPTYDGRLEYFNVVGEYLKGIAKSSANENFNTWYRLLNGLFALVKANLQNPKEIKDLLNELKKRRSLLIKNHTDRLTVDLYLDNKLQEITEKLLSEANHILVPTSSGDDDDMTFEGFSKGSDI